MTDAPTVPVPPPTRPSHAQRVANALRRVAADVERMPEDDKRLTEIEEFLFVYFLLEKHFPHNV